MAAGSDPFHHVRDTDTWELPGFVLEMLGRNTQFVIRHEPQQAIAFDDTQLAMRRL